MKQLKIDFINHLETLNYSKGTVKHSSLSIVQYFDYLKINQLNLYQTNARCIANNTERYQQDRFEGLKKEVNNYHPL